MQIKLILINMIFQEPIKIYNDNNNGIAPVTLAFYLTVTQQSSEDIEVISIIYFIYLI
jgi:hypothetical protein